MLLVGVLSFTNCFKSTIVTNTSEFYALVNLYEDYEEGVGEYKDGFVTKTQVDTIKAEVIKKTLGTSYQKLKIKEVYFNAYVVNYLVEVYNNDVKIRTLEFATHYARSNAEIEKLNGIFDLTLKISADKGESEAVEALTEAIDAMFTDEKISVGNEAIIASARQNAEFSRALLMLDSAIEAYESGISTDAASSDVELALGAIAELDGRAVSEEVVADIFSKFCVGK